MKKETKDVYQFEFAPNVYCSEDVYKNMVGMLSARIDRSCLEIRLKLIREKKEASLYDYYPTVKEREIKEFMQLVKTDRNFQNTYNFVVLNKNGNTYIFKNSEFKKTVFWRFRTRFNDLGAYCLKDRGLLIR